MNKINLKDEDEEKNPDSDSNLHDTNLIIHDHSYLRCLSNSPELVNMRQHNQQRYKLQQKLKKKNKKKSVEQRREERTIDTDIEEDDNSDKYALIVLNGNVCHFLPSLWFNATIRICADGGCNRIYDALTTLSNTSTTSDPDVATVSDDGVKPVHGNLLLDYTPNVIIGDFDSVRSDVLEFYRQYQQSHHITILHQQDQNSTDLQKAIEYLFSSPELSPRTDWRHLVIYGAFGGRLDQELGNLHTLHALSNRLHISRINTKQSEDILDSVCNHSISNVDHENNNVALQQEQYNQASQFREQEVHQDLEQEECALRQAIMLNEGNLCEILVPGKHRIYNLIKFEGPGSHCGLLSLGVACEQVTTKGLCWNLQHDRMEWGINSSANNIISDEIVEIECSAPLLWTTEFSASSSSRSIFHSSFEE